LKEFLKKNGIFVFGAALLVAIIAAVSIAAGGNGSDAASGAVNTLMRPVRGVMSSVVSRLEGIYGYMYGYDTIAAENEALKKRVAELEREYREYIEVAAENERLKELLEFSQSQSGAYSYETATVLSQSASSWQSAFTISKGSSSGLVKGNCVITESGAIVGRITSVSANSAVVTTLIDTTSNIGSLVWETEDTAVLCGDYELMKEGRAKLRYLPDGCTLAPGDTVITSGSGGIFPRGLVLGTVESVHSDSTGTGDWAIMAPAAEVEDIVHVYVITSFGGEE